MPIIQSLDRALSILDLFDERNRELKITEISAKMQLHKSTVHSLLKTLQLHRYIEQDAESGKYRLGMRLLEKAQLLLQGFDIREIARPHLMQLSQETGQTAHLVVLDGSEGVYIDKVEGAKAAIRYSRIGRRVPLHSSAVGKVLAAYLPEPELDRILANYHYHVQTSHTITNEADLRAELELVRYKGVAYDREENEQGVRCTAAPVYDHSGQVSAAVSISTMVSTVNDEEFAGLSALVVRTADSISKSLGRL